jgi:hypothetical protein
MDHFYTELWRSYKRACSASFLEEFFSETGFPAKSILGNQKPGFR